MPALSEMDMEYASKTEIFGRDSELVDSTQDPRGGAKQAGAAWQNPSVVHDFRNQGTDLRAYLASLEKESKTRDARIADLKNLAEFLDSKNSFASTGQDQNDAKQSSKTLEKADVRGETGLNEQPRTNSESPYSRLSGAEHRRSASNQSYEDGEAMKRLGTEALHDDFEHSDTSSEERNDEVGSSGNTPLKAYLNDLSPQRYQSFGADHDASDTSEYSDSSEGVHMEPEDDGGAYDQTGSHDLNSREALLRHLRFLNSQVSEGSQPVEVPGRDSARSDLTHNASSFSNNVRAALTTENLARRTQQASIHEAASMPTFESKHQSWTSSLNHETFRENLAPRENTNKNYADLGQANMHYSEEEEPHRREYLNGLNDNRRLPFQRSISENISAERASSSRSSIYEYRAQELQKRLCIVEAEAQTYADSLAEMHHVLKNTVDEALEYRNREKSLRSHIERLQMENRRHAHSRAAVEEIYMQKLEASRNERDMLTLQLGTAYEEIAMRDAALADSAAYMQALKRRNAELQIQMRTLLLERNQQGKAEKAQTSESEDSIFGLAHIRSKVEEAVQEAAQLNESDRKDKIKQLRIRWHPDKNPVLQEFATEVTKIINETVQKYKL
uniref:J domain-containing protein n=1 Tax=Hanusia phi TaxID=3032 RepID=A0A7S0HKS4_9CRYP|mmetsp:Transcript_22758/g.51290  ORF Transcript_22758/g.51290 Transcript_22758/m.51290 type:complete len:617 (+) Transcript_22758:172-2022(+)